MAREPEETFLEDPDRVGNAKYQLIVAIEASLDLANHLIARNAWRAPEDYADTFQVLAEHGALDSGFADRLGEMARFRNRLVHIYWDIDDALIHTYLNENLDDLERFLDVLLSDL